MLKDNRSFQEMRKAAVNRLQEHKDPERIAERAGVIYNKEKKQFEVEMLGETIEVSWPDCEMTETVEFWAHLLLLHYLDSADGSEEAGQWITFGAVKGSASRGTNFDREAAMKLEQILGGREPEELLEKFRQLGGVPVKNHADLAVVFHVFPRYPILINIWFADDEFPLSARMLIDQHADHYLSVEDAVTAGSELLEKLQTRMEV